MSQFPKARPTKAARPRKSAARPKAAAVHVFLNSGQTDHAGEAICAGCGSLRSMAVHDLRPAPLGANEIDARKLGEPGNPYGATETASEGA